MARPKIAAIVTEYVPKSHADVIVTKFLEGCETLDLKFKPQVEIVSLYTDQLPEKDMSREMSKKHNVPIFDTIEDALTLGTSTLAVDGILLIGEHGNYPHNEKGQHLYPRRRFFEDAVAIVHRAGRAVPMFNDKHLSYNWEDAKWMYDKAKELKIPFMAGSSLPVTWRRPPLEVPLDTEFEDALAIGYGGVESYGFHALETLQCMVERRKGGETGVSAIQFLQGDEVWEAGDDGRWSQELLEAALSHSETKKDGTPQENCNDPWAYMIEYRDGLRACVLMLNGYLSEFLFAAHTRSPKSKLLSTLFWLQSEQPIGHFGKLDKAIQRMFLTGEPTYPVERTLLTTGILNFIMESRYQGGKRLETPDLAVAYKAVANVDVNQ